MTKPKAHYLAYKKMLMSGGGGVKAVYRGTTTGAQTVELPAAVNMNKSFIYSVSKGSSGYVAATGTIALPNLILKAKRGSNYNVAWYSSQGGLYSSGGAVLNNANDEYFYLEPKNNIYMSGGSTNLTVKEYSARLIDETHIQTDGAVEWQLIEYN